MKLSLTAILFICLSTVASSFVTSASAASTTTIDHSYKSILRDIPLRNACVTGTEVQSIHPIRTCIQLEPSTPTIVDRTNLTPSWTCRQFANVQLVYPRSIVTEKCVKYAAIHSAEMSPIPECLDTETEVQTLPKTIDIFVSTDDFRGSKLDVVKKSFTFPACK